MQVIMSEFYLVMYCTI